MHKSKKLLQFPNSLTTTKKLSRKSVYQLKLNVLPQNSKLDDQPERPLKIVNYENDRLLEIKYSWEDLENWVPPSKKHKNYENINNELNDSIKSQNSLTNTIKCESSLTDISIQTSDFLLRDPPSKKNNPFPIKYSWQIIGKATQAALDNNCEVPDENYWIGKVVTARSFNYKNKLPSSPCSSAIDGEKRTYNHIVYTEVTQTSEDKELQTELTDSRVKYSWEDLTRPYLYSKT